MKQLILASTSTLHKQEYLAYLLPRLSDFFLGVKKLTFIAYAQPGGISLDEYTSLVRKAFEKIGINVVGLHEHDNVKKTLESAEAIFVGGGNTFRLVDQLYKKKLLAPLRQCIDDGIPYFGTSAGSNIAGLTMQTTNDMPIVDPLSYTTLGCIPYNLNVHYTEPLKNATHQGETRATRIKEFHSVSTIPVIGLREGSWLEVLQDKIRLCGDLNALLFRSGQADLILKSGAEF